jgi:hypothetical protein
MRMVLAAGFAIVGLPLIVSALGTLAVAPSITHQTFAMMQIIAGLLCLLIAVVASLMRPSARVPAGGAAAGGTSGSDALRARTRQSGDGIPDRVPGRRVDRAGRAAAHGRAGARRKARRPGAGVGVHAWAGAVDVAGRHTRRKVRGW